MTSEIPEKDALVAEDDKLSALMITRSLQKEHLEEKGYKVTLVDRADEAIAAMNTGLNPKLLITDFGLEDGQTGVELIVEARKRHPQIPIIMITGSPDEARRLVDASNLSWPIIVLGKPVNMIELPSQVLAAIELVKSPPPPLTTYVGKIENIPPSGPTGPGTSR